MEFIPETIIEKAQDCDGESLTPTEARTFKTCVGNAMYLSHHRPDIQHNVNTLSRHDSCAHTLQRTHAQCLTCYLLGTSEVCQELCRGPHTETLQVPVGSGCADLVKAAREEQFSFTDAQSSHGHAHRKQELFRAQRPSCTASAQEQSKVWESSTTFARMAVQNSTAASDRLTERT